MIWPSRKYVKCYLHRYRYTVGFIVAYSITFLEKYYFTQQLSSSSSSHFHTQVSGKTKSINETHSILDKLMKMCFFSSAHHTSTFRTSTFQPFMISRGFLGAHLHLLSHHHAIPHNFFFLTTAIITACYSSWLLLLIS